MALVNGSTYRLESRADPGRSLNVYSVSGTASSLANVCLWTSKSADICQQWTYKVSNNNKYFVCKSNTSVALDLYTGGTAGDKVHNYNAHVYAPSNSSYVIISDTDSGYIKIRLANYSNKYLTANQGNNGTNTGKDVNAAGNVYWYDGGLTDGSQEWKPVLVGGTSPTSEIVVTSMPAGIYSNNTEYFHPSSGMTSDTWAKNGGSTIASQLKAFYKKVYGYDPAGNANYLYNLYLSRLSGTNQYHIGVDITRGRGSTIKSGHTGTVVKCCETASNEVAIYDGSRTYYYLHMTNVKVAEGSPVTAGVTELGDERRPRKILCKRE